jgi:hypothetical protein
MIAHSGARVKARRDRESCPGRCASGPAPFPSSTCLQRPSTGLSPPSPAASLVGAPGGPLPRPPRPGGSTAGAPMPPPHKAGEQRPPARGVPGRRKRRPHRGQGGILHGSD